MAAEIELMKIVKTFNPGLFKKKVRALKGVDLQVYKGEVLGLIGPNGAGKSTIIRTLIGLIRPDSGQVLFRGQAVKGMDMLREIGYLPENPYLYDHLNISELLNFCGRVSGLDGKTISARSDELLVRLDLAEAVRRPLRTFSKGMLQRAGICFSLIHDPALVVFDEPMSGLDPVGRKMVYDLVEELKGQGKTIFFCSHILSDVERLCDRIGLLVQGQIVNVFESSVLTMGRMGLVHLRVDLLTQDQQGSLRADLEKITEVEDGLLLTVRPSSLGRLVEKLHTDDIEIKGSREDSVTLEELFIQATLGGQQ